MSSRNSFAVQASRIMEAFKRNWNGLEYSMKDKNCNHFCDEVAMKLGVQRPPGNVATGVITNCKEPSAEHSVVATN